MRLAARFMSSLLIASLLLPSLLAAPVAASGNTDHFVVSGLAASVTAGVATSITVEAQDNTNATDTSFTGTISIAVAGGAAHANYTFVGGDAGIANFNDIEFRTAGLRSVTVTDTLDSATGSASTTVDAAAASHLVVSGYPSSTVAGVSHNATVTAKDPFNNTDPTYADLVTVTATGGTTHVSPSVATALTNGVGTFGVTFDTVGTSRTITADDGTFSDSQGSISVTPAAADHLVAGGFTDPTVSGAAHTLTVTARDAFNNVATGYTGTVQITSTDGLADLPPNHTYTGGDAGTHGFSVTLNTAGTFTLTATDTVNGSLTDDQTGIDVTPGAANHVTVSGFGDPIGAGVGGTFTVTARDATGNVDPTYTGTVHFTSSDPQATLESDYTFVGGDAGHHLFSATLRTAGSQSITATDTGTPSINGTQSAINVTPDVATDLIVSGFTNPTIAGAPHNVTVTAKDQFGNTATGYTGTVAITSSDGAAALPGNHTYTGGNAGVFVFSVTLKTVGSQSITATDTVTGSINGAQTGITVNPGAATTLIVSGFTSPTTAGVSHSLTVTAKDGFGNTVTGYTGTVHFTSSDIQAVLPSNYTFVGGDSGTHTFVGVILKTAGSRSITATDTVTGSITGTQSSITVNPAGAATLQVAGFPSPTTSGVAHDVTVTALDAFGNTATGYTGTVAITSSDGAATLPADHTFTGGDAGTFDFSVTLNTTGTRSITATDTVTGSITGTQSNISVIASAATHFTVTGFNDPTVSGASHSVTVTALDALNNIATGYTGTVHFTSTDGSPTLPGDYTFTVGDAGDHTFAGVILRIVGEQSITATDTVTGTINGTQSAITVTPGAATHFAVTGYTSPATAGSSDGFTVTALDAANNTATGYTGTVHFTSSDIAADLPVNYTFTSGLGQDNGVHLFSATFHTAGSRTITATDTVSAGITGTHSAITVNPGVATHFLVSGFTNPTVAGQPHTVTVTAQDADGNTATGYLGTVAITSSDPAPTLPGNHTFTGGEAGIHGFLVTLNTSGTRSITATDTVTASITGQQIGIVVNGGTATHLSVTGFADPTVAGVSDSFTVTARDGLENVAAGYTGLVHVTSSDGAATFSADATLSNGVGTFSGTLRTAGVQSVIATDTISSGINGSQVGIDVTPAAATHFDVSGFTSPATAGVSDTFDVTALDAFENVATGYAGTVHFTTNDVAGTVPANSTLTNGTGSFSATLKTVGSRSITATDTLTPSITGTQSGITVDPAAAASYTVTGFANPTVAGISHSFTVTALDAFNNTATGYTGTVHFTSTDLQFVLGNYTFTGGDAGDHVFNAALKTAGTQSITGTDTVLGSITGSQGGIVVTAAAADHLTVTGYPSPTVAGASHAFTVSAGDAFGNTDPTYVGTIHFTSTDAFAPVLPANYTFIGGDAGAHLFSATLHQAGTQSITATDTVTASINGAQSGIVVTPGDATHFTVTGFTSPIVAGSLDGFDVVAFDDFENQATGYTGTMHFTSSDPFATLPADTTMTNGDGSFTATLRTVGTHTITATDTVSSLITGSQTGIVVTPAATDHFTVTGYPSPTTSAVAHNVTVTALDAFDNLTPAYAGTVHITSSDVGATIPANSTLTSGTGVFSVTLNTQGNQSITATDTVTSSITGSQTNIAIDPGPVDHIVISPSTASILATDTQTYVAEGFDAGNNDLGEFTSVTDFDVDGTPCAVNVCSAITVGAHTVTGHQTVDDVSDTATLTILNTDPVANDDTPADILEDASGLTIDVLANDTDINLDAPLLITGANDGALGTVVVNVDGSDLTYTPDLNMNGSDTFTYDISDGNGGTATATVHITITPVNDAPTFTVPASAPTIPEQTTVSPKTVAGFATAMSAGPADESAQTLSFTASNNANTLFSAQPSVNVITGDLTYTPAVNRNGVATVTLTLHDTGGTLDGGVNATAHTFTITVTGSNHTPFAINDSFLVVQGSPTMALPVLANDNAANPDVGEVLHIVNVTQGTAGGKVTITGGGTGLTYRPKTDFHGVDFFTYRVKDASLFSAYATVRVSVPKDTYKPVATAPVQTFSAQTIGTSTVTVRLTWTGTDKGYGISRFELWRSVNGHAYTRVLSTSGHAASVTLTVGTSYRFRVRAIDKKSNVGAFAYGPKFKLYRYQENSSSATYSSPWTNLNSSAYSGGHAKGTSTAGFDVTFRTLGRTFAFVTDAAPSRGTADVYIDGVLRAHLTLTRSITKYRYLAYSITFASSAAHSMRIVYTGGPTKRVDADAFIFLR